MCPTHDGWDACTPLPLAKALCRLWWLAHSGWFGWLELHVGVALKKSVWLKLVLEQFELPARASRAPSSWFGPVPTQVLAPRRGRSEHGWTKRAKYRWWEFCGVLPRAFTQPIGAPGGAFCFVRDPKTLFGTWCVLESWAAPVHVHVDMMDHAHKTRHVHVCMLPALNACVSCEYPSQVTRKRSYRTWKISCNN